MDYTLEKEYEVTYYEQNVNGNLKESGLLNFLQDIATISAEKLGFGPTYVFSHNFAWVVLKYRIELYKELKNLEKLVIKTESRGTTKLYAFRDFELYSQDKTLLGRVASAWALIDMESRKILPMQSALNFVKPFEKRENDLEYGKFEPLTRTDFQKEFEVRFDDIDVNKHANNCNYIIWALETLDSSFRLKYSPHVIDIKYKKELRLGDIVVSESQLIADNDIVTLHLIKSKQTEDVIAELKIVWKTLRNQDDETHCCNNFC